MNLTIAKLGLYITGLSLPLFLVASPGVDYMEAGAFGVVCYLLIRSQHFLTTDLKRTLIEIRDAIKDSKDD